VETSSAAAEKRIPRHGGAPIPLRDPALAMVESIGQSVSLHGFVSVFRGCARQRTDELLHLKTVDKLQIDS
jgi:hypothetical protein